MKILQLSTADSTGGAEKVAVSLHKGYRHRGHTSYVVVGQKATEDPEILPIDHETHSSLWSHFWYGVEHLSQPFIGKVNGAGRAAIIANTLAQLPNSIASVLGSDNTYLPGSHHILSLLGTPPDLIHCHNLHGNYFDLRALPALSREAPLVLTLHDAWLLSGHCAHSLDCDRWKTGCGRCPDLSLYPSVSRDATAFNWRQKRRILEKTRLYVSTPSRWLLERVRESILQSRIVEESIIPYGIDLTVFAPGDRRLARRKLGLREETKILICAGNKMKENIWKDFRTMVDAVATSSQEIPGIVFLVLGEEGRTYKAGRAEVRFVPYESDPVKVREYYRSADLYLHAARADTFPNSVLEALATGTPVIATSVGGIPEQVRTLRTVFAALNSRHENEATGILVPPGDSVSMSRAISLLLSNDALRRTLSEHAAADALLRFDKERMINQTLEWYEAVLSRETAKRRRTT